jgi:hypothetical protein
MKKLLALSVNVEEMISDYVARRVLAIPTAMPHGRIESIFHIVGTSSTCPLDLRQLTELLSQRTCRLCAMRRLMRRSKNAALFDDLVGPSEQRWGNREPECPRRLEINC